MKNIIKQLLREGLSKENHLEEGKFRSAVAGGLMGLGALAGGKAQAQEPTKPPIERPTTQQQLEEPRTPEEAEFIKGAIDNGFYKPIDDMLYNKGLIAFHHIPFFDRKNIYTKLDDGTKIKIPTKEYKEFLRNRR